MTSRRGSCSAASRCRPLRARGGRGRWCGSGLFPSARWLGGRDDPAQRPRRGRRLPPRDGEARVERCRAASPSSPAPSTSSSPTCSSRRGCATRAARSSSCPSRRPRAPSWSPPRSPIQRVGDLAGKRIGVAGGALDKSWLLLKAHAQETAGIDLAGRRAAVLRRAAAAGRQARERRARRGAAVLELLRPARGQGLPQAPRRRRDGARLRLHGRDRPPRLHVRRAAAERPPPSTAFARRLAARQAHPAPSDAAAWQDDPPADASRGRCDLRGAAALLPRRHAARGRSRPSAADAERSTPCCADARRREARRPGRRACPPGLYWNGRRAG